jgi:restriction endonuclease
MGLSLAQTQAVSQLARHLYDYLPGSSAWQGTYTFAHAASESGVGGLWPGGSKLPALTSLLENTLAGRSGAFCPLVERIVRNGIKYRAEKGSPLSRSEIVALNELVRMVGFKIPALWDPTFLGSLPEPQIESARQAVETTANDVARATERRKFEATVAELRTTFLALQTQSDRNAAGLSLERVLNALFALYDLEPNEPFRIVGEQIDGSFLLDSEVYLLEAKWTAGPVDEPDLLVFRGKVEGKSSFTRGLFISINGFSRPAMQAITTGKQPTFVMMDRADLYRVLEGHLRLDGLLRRKVRLLAERGRPFVPVSELFEGGGAR